MDVLSNREWAFIIWFVIAVCYFAVSTKMSKGRVAFKGVVKAFLQRKILIVVFLISIYIFLITYLLSKLSVWDVKYLKLTLFWGFSFGLLSVFKLQESKAVNDFFKEAAYAHFKLTVILEYLVGFYSFSLITEIMLMPVLFIISVVYVFSEKSDKHTLVHKLAGFILAVYVLAILFMTLNNVHENYTTLINLDTFNELLIPFLLTIIYLPFLFMLHVYMRYESIFVGLGQLINDEALLNYSKMEAIKSFYWRTNLLGNWRKIINVSVIETKTDVDNSINKALLLDERENNPEVVNPNKGWSPYIANEFLSEFGLRTGLYNNYCGDEVWHTSSNNIDINKEDLFPCSIAYYIEGCEHAVEEVSIKLYVTQQESFKDSVDFFIHVASRLFEQALNKKLPDSLVSAIMNGKNYDIEIGRYSIVLIKRDWNNYKLQGFDMKLSISLTARTTPDT